MNPTPAKSKIVKANGLDIHVASAGNGPHLLFITGTNADLRKANTPLNSLLTDSFNVVTYDQRGMGQSDKPNVPYTMLDYATDAVAVLDELGWNDAFIAGYSFGGMVAQEMAIRWPNRVKRLALLATTAGGDAGSSYPIHNHIDLEPYERAQLNIEVADLRFTPQWQLENPELAHNRIQLRVTTDSEYENEPGAIAGRNLQLAARAEHNTAERLHKIHCPTIVLAGVYDGQARLEAQKTMASLIVNCEFVAVEGSHGMLYENTKSFEKVSAFFKSHTAQQ